MIKYKFYRIVREPGKSEFKEAGVAWFEGGKGTVVEAEDSKLARLLSEPLEVHVGELAPYIVRPSEERYLGEAANELHDEGYLGRPIEE